MLPPLASSLAYSNYSQWRVSHSDQDLPDVTPGVSLTDLYKAGEREVRAGKKVDTATGQQKGRAACLVVAGSTGLCTAGWMYTR